ncbi:MULTISPECIES: hypothetical protein [Rhodococcus]|jgi:hypothetical protein|uniref:Uncharacterized protein n=1 Tax=Rhodococcus jostii TaxID=132919 RepID=A0ABU4C6Y3_RHOJO|nr:MULTISPECIES: hypothetical protein [Rhodococcus]MDH6289808.1 hypothetical protein [Rhodococcus opacus]MDI9973739.1 hypothetical protein [Rhodococcus sp. IEGM 1307]MDV6279279.1 hypothetical protein [Rhodococcus jostii]
MRFEVISAGEGRYRRPDGSIGRRIVQLRVIPKLKRFKIGLFTDDNGRPELVVHPDVKLGRVHFPPVDEQPEP